MGSVTLSESAKLTQNQLIIGIIENVITVNRMYEVTPFDGIEGNALAYNRENTLAPVATVGVGDVDGTIGSVFAVSGTNQAERASAKDPATFTQVTSSLTTIMGDAEVNGLIQATRSNMGNDQTAIQIASKAKSAGRKWQEQFVNGDGTNFTFPGLLALMPAAQTLSMGNNGGPLSFTAMDNVMDIVIDKDGEVDYFTMNARTIRSFNALLRALGGAHIMEALQLPSGKTVPAYRGVPIFRNDYIPLNMTQGTSSNATAVFAGTFDDGARQHGFAGLTAQNAVGIQVVDVGESEWKDERIWRVKWYCGLALFSEKGIGMLQGVTN
jgi:hypothetical protein